ncbi:hypothetical protein C8Q76DRAFT_633827, partial [Earliella scabrosa]
MHVVAEQPQSDSTAESFMQLADDALRRGIIREWQDEVSTSGLTHVVCAACARRTLKGEICSVHANEANLHLLRNDSLPEAVKPTTYNFDAYKRALLCPAGMTNRWVLAHILLCRTCQRELCVKKRMPKLCLANWLYYGYEQLPVSVKDAFGHATQFDKLLVCRARASRISYRFTELGVKDAAPREPGGRNDPITSQRCIRGNVLVMPQNSTHLNSVLPPAPEVIRNFVCAVFIGKTRPTRDTIGRLGPVLVHKSLVHTMIQFLLAANPHYACDTEFHGFSEDNWDVLLGPGASDANSGVPCALDVGFLEDSEVISGSTADYTGRNDASSAPGPADPLVMEHAGYTCGDDPPLSYQEMKMKALSHCLTRGRFIRSQAGDRFVPDFENPSLLTWLFPHLDPWGIGGFHHPNRLRPITLEEQLKYLLQVHDSPFERDADFAFVYYNILQKKHICDSVRFRVKVSQQREIVRDLLAVDRTLLLRMISQYDGDHMYQPQTAAEQALIALVNRVGTVLRDLPGTIGYKLRMRNEIRSLITFLGSPAFFITLNPSDVHHPFVRLFAGHNVDLESVEAGQELGEWERKLLVARNPGACAKFFHVMVSSFINIILRHGRVERGLFG